MVFLGLLILIMLVILIGDAPSLAIFSLCGSAVSWKASLQSVVALSTTEAEYVASTEGVKEAIWMRGHVSELGVPHDVLKVYCDSHSAICLTKNDMFQFKTKHIDISTTSFVMLLLKAKLL
jgi:hypothetical protein